MRIARVIGTVTLSRKLPELKAGSLLIIEALDAPSLAGLETCEQRAAPMPESLVAIDELGAAEGQLIAVSEGGEASMPYRPDRVPVDAYNAAILDTVELTAPDLAAV